MIVSRLKAAVHRSFAAAGYRIKRVSVDTDASRQLACSLARFDVSVVFDIGANSGQFGRDLRQAGYRGRLVSFEPQAEPHAALVECARRNGRWQVHDRGALGDRDGTVDIHVAGNSLSSSILPMLPLHSAAAAGSAYVGIEQAPVWRLDSVAAAYLAADDRPFLKLDAQGFEWAILDGAADLLPRVAGVLCEVSLVPLYEGQRMWRETVERLQQAGFTLWAINPGFVDARDGRLLQADVTFYRVDERVLDA